jgi:itaconate CoA-transferase
MYLPLHGFTIVALEQAVAMPLATRNLTDLGARVIKVEQVSGGDLARGYDHVVSGTGAHFVWLNRGKESIAVDLKTDLGSSAVRTLIDHADVFVQNLAPGAAERLGFGATSLRLAHPELIVVELSGYGRGGPHESRKAYDMLIQAEAGLISITGTPEVLVKTGIPTADIASGMYCSQAIIAALLRRVREGSGATIEVSMLEATLEWMGHALYTQIATGTAPPRMGLGHAAIAPYGAFPTRDGGQILIGVQSEHGWQLLVRDVLEAPELASDSRFSSNILRVENRAACDAAVAERTSRIRREDLEQRLAAAGVPAAGIRSLDEVVKDPQLKARRRWREIATEGARVPALLPPATFDDVEASMGDVPALGAHTTALLREAGLEEPEIRAAIASGIAFQSDVRRG